MRISAGLIEPLAALGRQSSRALVVAVVLGIGLPPVGAALKPYVTEAVFVLLEGSAAVGLTARRLAGGAAGSL